MAASSKNTLTTYHSPDSTSIATNHSSYNDSSFSITTLEHFSTDSGLYTHYLNTTKVEVNSTETRNSSWIDIFLNKTEHNLEEAKILFNSSKNSSNDFEIFDAELKTILPTFANKNNASEFSLTREISTWNTIPTASDQGLSFNMTVEDYLDELNTDFAHRVLPAVVVLAVLMVLGAVGNIFVLFVYTCRTKRGTIMRFVQALAVFDLLSCCVAIPGEIIDMTNNYTFGRDPLCKVVRTVNLFCTVASGATLVVVAIDRYKRICCPLRRQLSPKSAVIIICCCVIASAVISLPTAIVYGSRTISTDLLSVNGTDCSISDQFIITMFPLAYNSLQMFLFLVGAVTLIVLYTLIGSKVCHHVHQKEVRRKSLSLGRSRLSPASPSMYSSYSTNMDNACRLGSEISTPVNRLDTAELVARFRVTDAKQDLTFNVAPVYTAKTKDNRTLYNNNNSVGLAGQGKTPLISCEKCHQNVTRLTYNSSEQRENGCHHSSTEELVDKSNLTNTTFNCKSEIGTAVDAFEMKNPMKSLNCAKTVQDSQCGQVQAEETSTEVDSHKHFSQNDSTNVASNENVSVISSKSDNDPNLSNDAASNDTLRSGTHTSLQCHSLSKSPNRSASFIPVTNNDIKPDIFPSYPLSSTDNNSFTTSLSNTPLEKLDIPPDLLLNTKCGDSICTSFSPLTPQEIGSNLPDGISTDSNKSKQQLLNNFTSENTYSDLKLKTADSVLTNTEESRSKQPFMESKECETHREYCSVSNDLLLRRNTTGNKQGSFRLKQHHLSLGYFSSVSEVRKHSFLNKSVARADGNVDTPRMDEKEKTKDNIHNNGTRRTTLMLFFITIIYIVSFLPHLVLMAIKALDEDSLNGHGSSWELAQNLLIRSYFINSMANPVIYSFFSKNFFRECKNYVSCYIRNNHEIK